jgi:hypothetical protein
MRRLVVVVLFGGACATAGLPAGEDCASLLARIHASRARGDDKSADVDTERIARDCPESRGHLLELSSRPRRNDSSLIFVDYQVALGPGDHLIRLALTFAGRRLEQVMPLGTGSLEVAADLRPVSGPPAHLTWTRELAITEPELLKLTVKLTRTAGERRFALNVELPPGTKLRDLKTVGKGGGSAEPRQFPTPSASEPPFDPPADLRAAGAHSSRFEVCPQADGTVTRLVLDRGELLPHPAHLGAAVDWLRATRYQMPPANSRGRWWCILRTLRWDRTERPASAETWTETK